MGRIFERVNIFDLGKVVKNDIQWVLMLVKLMLVKWVLVKLVLMVVVKENEARNCLKSMLAIASSIQIIRPILLNLMMKLKLVSVGLDNAQSKLKWALIQVRFCILICLHKLLLSHFENPFEGAHLQS